MRRRAAACRARPGGRVRWHCRPGPATAPAAWRDLQGSRAWRGKVQGQRRGNRAAAGCGQRCLGCGQGAATAGAVVQRRWSRGGGRNALEAGGSLASWFPGSAHANWAADSSPVLANTQGSPNSLLVAQPMAGAGAPDNRDLLQPEPATPEPRPVLTRRPWAPFLAGTHSGCDTRCSGVREFPGVAASVGPSGSACQLWTRLKALQG